MTFFDLPALGQPLEGGIFAGLTTTPEGRHCAVVLLDERPPDELPWTTAIEWAAGLGATLPTRPVAAMLYANLRERFEAEWHWTADEFDGSFAWYQYFLDGGQGIFRKSYEDRARAVRLLPLEAILMSAPMVESAA